MRRTLRQMVDSGVLAAGVSPMAQHISKNLQDPVGQTQDDFDNLGQAKIKYDMAKESMRRKLLPVQSVLTHVNQLHQLDGPDTAGVPQPDGFDPTDASMGYNDQGDPANMGQQPGQQQMNNPQQASFGVGAAPKLSGGPTNRPAPGVGAVAPGTGPMAKQNEKIPTPGAATQGAQTQVRPPKMGVPKPGQANGGTRAGNPSSKGKAASSGKKKPDFGNSKVQIHINSDRDKKAKLIFPKRQFRSEGDRFTQNRNQSKMVSAAAVANLRF